MAFDKAWMVGNSQEGESSAMMIRMRRQSARLAQDLGGENDRAPSPGFGEAVHHRTLEIGPSRLRN